MTNEEKIQYWIKLSDKDLIVAEDLLSLKHYLQMGFFCHLAIEKIFKACYEKLKKETPPYKHKLALIAQQAGFYNTLSEKQKDFAGQLDAFNIEARYPEHKDAVAKSLTLKKSADLLKKTKELQLWIKEKTLSIK